MQKENKKTENKYGIENVLIKNKNYPKRSLVFCETYFQLFSTLCIFSNYKKHAPVDIVLTDATDFSKAKQVLEKDGPFEHIYTLEVRQKIIDLWLGTKEEERLQIAEDAGSYLPDINFLYEYTDVWVNLDTMASKMFYYKMVKNGMVPNIHFVDEGTSSYVLDFSSVEKDFINHNEIYGEKSFPNNISDMWLNEPRLYAGQNKKIPLYAIPNQVLQEDEVKELFIKIFGKGTMPKERFIFFEESFAADLRTTNDLELFTEISKIVGKENIIVKRHPRNLTNRFKELGYKVIEEQNIPWEALMLTNDISDKVLISIGSSATLTPFYLYKYNPTVFLLKNLLVGKVAYLENPKLNDFFEKNIDLFNQGNQNIYKPKTLKEMQLAMEYIHKTKDVKSNAKLLEYETDSYLYDPLYKEIEEANQEKTDMTEVENIENEDIKDEQTDFISYEEKIKIIEKKLKKLKKPYMSIVVPVYNVEKYLRQCLNSLVFQTLEDIEIIVVNDGSTDNSQDIIDEYAKKFPNKIIPLYKKNAGQSLAREYGAKHAKGKYIGFVDSDDWMDCRYCQKCLEALLYDDTKVVTFGVVNVYPSGYSSNGLVNKDSSMESFILNLAASFNTKVYDRDYLMKNVPFLDMWYEDIAAVNSAVSYLDKISVLEDRLYYYRREREFSTTNSHNDIRQLDQIKAEKISIETTNPKYKDYQIARSVSRLITLNVDMLYDSIIDFVKSYTEDLKREEVRELISAKNLEKIDEILDNKIKHIPNNIYVGAFGIKKSEKDSLAKKYENVLFGTNNKIILLDEKNCNIDQNEVIKKLYQKKEYEKLSKYFSLEKIYETGGIAINGDFIFNKTLNKFMYLETLFCFEFTDKMSDALFAAKPNNPIMKEICDKFIESEGKTNISDCIEYVCVGKYGLHLDNITNQKFGINVYDAKTFIYKYDDSNISSMIKISEDNKNVIVPINIYEQYLEFIFNKNKAFNNMIKRQKKASNETNNKLKKLKKQKKKLKEEITELEKINQKQKKKLKNNKKIMKRKLYKISSKVYKMYDKLFK